MNVHPAFCQPPFLSEWILAPIYRQESSRLLPLWLTHPSTESPVAALPLHSPQQQFLPDLHTFKDLGLARSHQCRAAPRVKEQPYNIIKPKAVRLYDIHVSVESRLPRLAAVSCLSSQPGATRDEISPFPTATITPMSAYNRGSDWPESRPPFGPGFSSHVPLPPCATDHCSTRGTSSACLCCSMSIPGLNRVSCESSKRMGFPTATSSRDVKPPQRPNRVGHSLLPLQFLREPQHSLGWVENSESLPKQYDFHELSNRIAANGSFNHFNRASHEQSDSTNSFSVQATPFSVPLSGLDLRKISNHGSCSHADNCCGVGSEVNHFERGDLQVLETNRHEANNESRSDVFKIGHKVGGRSSQKRFLYPWENPEKNIKIPHSHFNDSKTDGREEKQQQRKMCVLNRVRHGRGAIDSNNYSERQGGIVSRTRQNSFLKKERKRKPIRHHSNNFSDEMNQMDDLERKEKNDACPHPSGHRNCDHEAASNNIAEKRIKNYSQSSCLGQTKSSSPSGSSSRSSSRAPGPSSVCDRKLFKCPQCRYTTDRKNNLKRHIVTMHHESNKTLECCGLSFQSKAALRDHNSVFHRGGYRCSFCARNFCRKALLRRHLTVHSGQKDFFCELCGYATSHKSNLERHQKVHVKKEDGAREIRQPTVDQQCSRNHNALSSLHKKVLYFPEAPQTSHICDVRSNLPDMYFPCVSQSRHREMHDFVLPLDAIKNNQTQGLYLEVNNGDPGKATLLSGPKTRVKDKAKMPVSRVKTSDVRRLNHRTAPRLSSFLLRSRRTRGLLPRRIRDTYSHRDPNKHGSTFTPSASLIVQHLDEKEEKTLSTEEELSPNSNGKSSALTIHNPKDGARFSQGEDQEHIKTLTETNEQEKTDGVGKELEVSQEHSTLDFPACDNTKDKNTHFPSSDYFQPKKYADEFEIQAGPPGENISQLSLGKTFASTGCPYFDQKVYPQVGSSSPVNYSKQDIRRRLCDLLYFCPECEERFQTQSELGQHNCSSTVNAPSSFRMPIVTALQKSYGHGK